MNLNGASFKGTVDIGDLVSKCERETMELNRFITLASLQGTAFPQIENLSLAARLEKMSVEQGIAKNALIVNILWRYIRKDATS